MTRREVFWVVTVLLALVVAFFVFIVPDWFWHPLGYCPRSLGLIAQRDCVGYNYHSGIGSDLGEITLVGATATLIAGFWRAHNCHHHGCPWLQFHPHPEHGHPVCKKHFEEHPDGVIPGKPERTP